MDPDQLACEKPADLDLHFFKNRIYHDSFVFDWLEVLRPS